MIKYFRDSFKRKLARRITKEYPAIVEKFLINENNYIEFANWDNPLVERKVITSSMVNFFKQFIKEGDFVIDIGAHIGDTTVPMALCAGATGLTLGFDPNPYTNKILKINSTLNKGKLNIQPVNCAISTEEEEEYYFISSEASFSNGGISLTEKSKHGKHVYGNKIKGYNLKIFLEKSYKDYLKRLTFIKIDTEGYDKEIIKSITDLILEYKPVIVAESFGKATDSEKKELFDVIERNGYDIYYFEDFGLELNVEKVNSNSDMLKWKHTVNIYALPK